MENESNAAPIHHTTGSAIGSTAAGAAGGAVVGGVKGAVLGFAILAAVGTGLGLFIGLGGLTFIGGAMATGGGLAITAHTASVIGWTLAGLVGGVAAGSAFGLPIGGIIGGLFGGAKGGVKASDRVRAEQGAATELQAQVDIAKAQATAQSATTNVYAPSAVNDNKYSFPAQGTAMNPASPKIYAANDNAYATDANQAQALGTVAGPQLQRV